MPRRSARQLALSEETEEPSRYIIQCAFCGKDWQPGFERNPSQVHCPACSEERQEQAKKEFGLRPFKPEELQGNFYIGRRRR